MSSVIFSVLYFGVWGKPLVLTNTSWVALSVPGVFPQGLFVFLVFYMVFYGVPKFELCF